MQKTSPLDSNLFFSQDVSDEITKIIGYHFNETGHHNTGFKTISKEHPFYDDIVLTCLDLGYIGDEQIPDELKDDPKFWLKWLNCNSVKDDSFILLEPFDSMSRRLRSDERFAEDLILANPFTIKYFDKSIQENKDFIYEAIVNGNARAYDAILKTTDKAFTLKCMDANWKVWMYISNQSAKDLDIFKTAFEVDPFQTLNSVGSAILDLIKKEKDILMYAFQRSATSIFHYVNNIEGIPFVVDMLGLKPEPEAYFEKCLLNLGNHLGIDDKIYKYKGLAGIAVNDEHKPLLDFIFSKIRTSKLEKLYPKLKQDVVRSFVNDEIARRNLLSIKVEPKKKHNKNQRKIVW